MTIDTIYDLDEVLAEINTLKTKITVLETTGERLLKEYVDRQIKITAQLIAAGEKFSADYKKALR